MGVLTKQERIRRFDLSWDQFYGQHLEEQVDTDDMPTSTPGTDLSYEDVVIQSDPAHFWRLGEDTATLVMADTVVGGKDGTYSVSADTVGFNLSGALYTDPDSGKKFDYGSRYARVEGPLDGFTAGAVTAFSIEFFLQLMHNSEDTDGLIGWQSTAAGFKIATRDSRVYLSVNDLGPLELGTRLDRNKYYHVVFTIDTAGLAKAYVNGTLVSMLSIAPMKVPVDASDLQISRVDGSGDVPNWGCDELAIYDHVLTASEITEHYQRSITTKGIGGGYDLGDADSPSPIGDSLIPPSLTDEEDVTDLVVAGGWSVTRDSSSIVQSAALNLVDKWAYTDAKDKLKAGTYVVIEVRYRSQQGHDTGWIPVAHLISQGVKQARGSDGRKQFQCQCMGLLSLLSIDLVNYDVSPDIIRVPRREASLTYQDADVVVYRLTRIGSTGEFLYNWADRPMVRIWASDFQTVDDDVTASDVMPIKSSNGAIQVVGGAGQVVFNSNYYNDKFKENGMGDPGTIELQLHRFATVEDIARVPLVSVDNTYDGPVPISAKITVDNSSGFIRSGEGYVGRTIIIKSGAEKGEMFKITAEDFGVGSDYVFDVITLDKQLPDFADYSLVAGDTVQVTDANLAEDAIWKILWRRGFQMKDSSKPLFVELAGPEMVIQVPPLKYRYSDNQKDVDLLQEVLEFCAPNYGVRELPHGAIVDRTAKQKPLGRYDHDISDTVIDDSEDGTTSLVYTRVIVEGEGTGNFNVALHKDYGGYAIAGGFKTDDVYDGDTGSVSKTIDEVDDIITQVFDIDPKTPQVAGSAPYNYGLIYEQRPAKRSIDLTDVPFIWLDLGRNSDTGRPWMLDQVEFISFSSFRDGTIVNQSLRVYYMTEEDYISITNHRPGAIPGDAADEATIRTNMRDLEDSHLWKIMVDETGLEEGETIVPTGEFIDGAPVAARFIKVEVAQPWYRMGETNTDGVARIVLSGMKLWLSRKIVRSVELGIDGEFQASNWVEKATRIRRRTVALDKNISLETPSACETFGMNELRELASDFDARNFVLKSSMVDLDDTVRYLDPETGEESNFLVRSVDIEGGYDDKRNIRVVDYLNVG